MNSLELKDKQAQLIKRCHEIVDVCKKEVREMTEDEKAEFDKNKEEIDALRGCLKELKARLEGYDEELPKDEEENEEHKNKNNRNIMKKNYSIVKEIRNALENGSKHFTINADAEMRADTTSQTSMKVNSVVTGEEGSQNTDLGIHDNVVEEEVQGILEPLYAKSVLAQLGVKWYSGLPQGDISVPVMGKGNVGWADEIGAAAATANSFSNITLKPKRLTAYVDISKQLIAQDTIGVESAIRRDIVNALNDKLEATILGAGAKSDNKPAGIFAANVLDSATAVSTFAGLCDQEAKVENNNVYGQMKYLLNPSAKAALRAMAKSSKTTELVLQGGEVDGVPTVVTSNVKDGNKKLAVYGDFSNLAIGSWGNVDITLDEYTQAVNGCIRLVINAYFDAVVLRKEAFVVSTL